MIDRLKPDLIIQQNDMHFFENEIVNQAKKRNISTLLIQWAFTGPEKDYFENKVKKKLFNKNSNPLKFKIKEVTASINNFLNSLLGLTFTNKLSIAQGDSDKVSVINKFTKDLLIKQGVDSNKIIITGHLDYDPAIMNRRKKERNKIFKILYISQPFYGKDLKRIKFDQQMKYIRKLYSYIDKVFRNYCFYIKLHPAENIEDYISMKKISNIKIKTDFDKDIQIANADLIITSHSTSLIMCVISSNKPILTLNILNIPEADRGYKRIGLDDQIIKNWDELEVALKKASDNPAGFIREANKYLLITDGKCRKRIINLITKMVENEF